MERVAVVGAGRIGLCLALNLVAAGYRVLAVDRDDERVAAIAARRHDSSEPGMEAALAAAGDALAATADIADLPTFDAATVFVTVDTPTVYPAGYDHGRVDAVLAALFALGRRERVTDLAIMCTTLPGYCDGQAAAASAHGYALSYNPVFVAQGSILRDQREPDQVLIGEADAQAGARLEALHRRVCANVPAVHRMSRLSAEIAKLATNCFLTTKIAFANAIGDLATQVGAEPDAILAAIGADHRIGADCLRYGYGYGGPCFPRDNRALGHYAEGRGVELLLAQATGELNRRHLHFQLERLLREHPAHAPIEFDGVTYKPGTDILEESQPLALAEALARAGRRVVIRERAGVLRALEQRYGTLFEYRPLDEG